MRLKLRKKYGKNILYGIDKIFGVNLVVSCNTKPTEVAAAGRYKCQSVSRCKSNVMEKTSRNAGEKVCDFWDTSLCHVLSTSDINQF